MNKKQLLLLSSLFAAPALFSGEKDKKMSASTSSVSLECYKCDAYVLTAQSFFKKNFLKWESILKPSMFVRSSDISKFLPVSSLPAIHCLKCKELCCEPVWNSSGGSLQAMYKIIQKTPRS